jgi:hypothetical protein
VSADRVARHWRWAALPFGLLYLVLLAIHFRVVIATTNLDADTVSAPVIGQLFGSAPAHASIVLGEFGWYATLLFELLTKWLPLHRQIWEITPYAMALAGAVLAAWSVWQVAGRWAASLTLVLLICAAPDTLHLLLSMTQHAPDWFCLTLLAALLVALEQRAAALPRRVVVPLTLLAGVVVGVNAASDPLVLIAGVVPFGLALLAGYALRRGPDSIRALRIGAATLVVGGVAWLITDAVVSALNVTSEPGLNTTMLAAAEKIADNFRLWWQSIAVLGNGDFFGRHLTFSSGVAVVCGLLSIGAVALLPRVGWRELHARAAARPPAPATAPAPAPARLAFMVFWCSSATLLSAAFVLSATPVDVHADRYLVGLIYAAASVLPAIAAGRAVSEAAALAGTCVFALGGVISMAQDTLAKNVEGFPSTGVTRQIERIAVSRHLTTGYAGYWDAAPITWASHFRVQVYPVSICDVGAHLCRFDLHYISSWYTPRPGSGSFLLTDPSLANVSIPTPDLGAPTGVYRLGRITMYTYPYDLAAKIIP